MSTYFRTAPQLITGSSSLSVASNVNNGSTTIYSVPTNKAAIVEVHTVVSTTSRFPRFLSLTTDQNVSLTEIGTVPSGFGFLSSYGGLVDDGRPVYDVTKFSNGRIGHSVGTLATNPLNVNASIQSFNEVSKSSSPSNYLASRQFNASGMFGSGEIARLTAFFQTASNTGTITFSYRVWLFGD